MKLRELYRKALDRTPLTADEAWRLYDEAPLFELAATADRLRRETVPDPQVVTWQIDRNVNVTNVCISGCRFCNFHCKPHQTETSSLPARSTTARSRRLSGWAATSCCCRAGCTPI